VVAEDLNPVIDAVNALSGNTTPPKKYVAILNQTGTNAPTATILENTLGFTPVWSYISPGIYHLTYTGGFPTRSKTFIVIQNTAFDHQTGMYWNSADDLELYTATLAGVYANGQISYATVVINLYE
jgi:hypothetical protein